MVYRLVYGVYRYRCMVYWLVYGVQAGVWGLGCVWCTGWCMVYRLVYGVQAGVWGLGCVWCTGWCMVYRLVYGVQAGVWGLGWCMVYRLVYGQTQHANTSTYLHNTPAHTRHTNLQSRSSLPPCSLCRCQVGTPKKQYRGPFLGEGEMAPTCRMLSAHYLAMDPLRKNLGMTCSKFMRDVFASVPVFLEHC